MRAPPPLAFLILGGTAAGTMEPSRIFGCALAVATACTAVLLHRSTDTSESHFMLVCLAGQLAGAAGVASGAGGLVKASHDVFGFAVPASLFVLKQRAGLVLVAGLMVARMAGVLLAGRCLFFYDQPGRGTALRHDLASAAAIVYALGRIIAEG